MPRKLGGDAPRGWGKLIGKLLDAAGDAVSPEPAKRRREPRSRMERDSRRGMSGRGRMAQYASAGPLTLEELLARLDAAGRAAVLAMTAEQQLALLRLWEALERHLQAPGSHKAAVLDKLARMLVNGRLLADRRAHGGLLARLAPRVGAAAVGPLRSRVDGLLFLSQVVSLLAEPGPTPVARRSPAEQGVAALTNSLALGWPARWSEMVLGLAFEGSWQGLGPVLRPGGSPPDGLIQGSLLAFARTLPPEGAAALGTGTLPPGSGLASPDSGRASPGSRQVPPRPGQPQAETDLTVGQLDLLARILETDRGAELDVEGRDPAWALSWLAAQLEGGSPARAGLVVEGKGLTVRVTALSERLVVCDGLTLVPPAFLASLRRVVVDGDFLSRVGLG